MTFAQDKFRAWKEKQAGLNPASWFPGVGILGRGQASNSAAFDAKWGVSNSPPPPAPVAGASVRPPVGSIGGATGAIGGYAGSMDAKIRAQTGG